MNRDETAHAGVGEAPGGAGLSLVLVALDDDGRPHLAYLPDSPAPGPDAPRPASRGASANGQEPR